MNWPTDDYLSYKHPLQKEISRNISKLLKIPTDEMLTARDDCGAPTYLLQLSQMAVLYAHLSDSDVPGIELPERFTTGSSQGFSVV